MSIRILITGTVKDGMTAEWKAVAAKATAACRDEEGTLVYRWYLADSGQAINYDEYTDEAAFFAHFAAANESGVIEGWMGSEDVQHVAVLDPVNDEMAEALKAFGAVYYSMAEGF
ncbi:MAG: antibiotic biosynthesis monooxygenase [Acidimicrobiia bacterium]|nr:antibiotic biosynthesis monooxygenase [Acidimicrobiia bacterium]